ncbi:MAG: hypothetical protein CMJ81_20640 [Planctomycetaceae bacterium]|nr:hypothetical protein [Planctomycetaceae bacterium]MBP63671.1 hypothetical protein [Planctomycetaceae bacterium]
MTALLQLQLDHFLVFVLVLSRMSGLVITAPILGSRSIPLRIRGLLAVSLALLITPLFWSPPVADSLHLVTWAILIAQEILLGASLGLGIMILMMGLRVTGQLVSQMSALNLANVFDPSFNTNLSVFSQLLEVVTLMCFLLTGGHRQVMSALLETFRWMPPGEVRFSPGWATTFTEITTHSFVLGIRAAAPAIVALLMATLVLGLIARTLPQLNILAVGFSFNTVVLTGTLALSLSSIVWLFQGQVTSTLESVLETIRAPDGLIP